MEETWKDIKGFEGYYQISNLSNVRSVDRVIYVVRNGVQHTRRCNGKLLKPICEGKAPYHRYVVHLSKNSWRLTFCAAQEIFRYFSVLSECPRYTHIRCDQTGRVYVNMKEIANDLHLEYYHLTRCIRMHKPYRGYTFTKLMEGDI